MNSQSHPFFKDYRKRERNQLRADAVNSALEEKLGPVIQKELDKLIGQGIDLTEAKSRILELKIKAQAKYLPVMIRRYDEQQHVEKSTKKQKIHEADRGIPFDQAVEKVIDNVVNSWVEEERAELIEEGLPLEIIEIALAQVIIQTREKLRPEVEQKLRESHREANAKRAAKKAKAALPDTIELVEPTDGEPVIAIPTISNTTHESSSSSHAINVEPIQPSSLSITSRNRMR